MLVSACQPEILNPPRLATKTAVVEEPLFPTSTPVLSVAPTPTGGSNLSALDAGRPGNILEGDSLRLWVDETSNAHNEILKLITDEYSDESGVSVELVLVAPRLMPALVQQAVISDTLPDIILHSLAFTPGWAEQGIINPDLATDAINTLGEETFSEGALDAVRFDTDLLASIPSDGWRQLIIYRTDWFDNLNLNPPVDYDSLASAAASIDDPDSSVSGIVVPTDSSLASTQQVFEHMAIANGCRLIDNDGRITLLHPACLEALEFYRQIVNSYSPVGFQTDVSALNAYLSGRTGIIISSPSALPYLAGVIENEVPSCPACVEPGYLATNSGFVTNLSGSEENGLPTAFSELRVMSITSVAREDLAVPFVEYWFNEGYSNWLSVNPERKVPLRKGTIDQPTKFSDSWRTFPIIEGSPTLEEVFGVSLSSLLIDTASSVDRWGFAEGEGNVMTYLYKDLLISPLLQEMLSGYFTSSETIIEMYRVIIDALPEYNYPIEIMPTATDAPG